MGLRTHRGYFILSQAEKYKAPSVCLIAILVLVAVSFGSFGEAFLLLLLLLFLLLALAFCSLLWRFALVFGFSLLAVFFLGGRGWWCVEVHF